MNKFPFLPLKYNAACPMIQNRPINKCGLCTQATIICGLMTIAIDRTFIGNNQISDSSSITFDGLPTIILVSKKKSIEHLLAVALCF